MVDTETGLYYLNARYYNPEWSRFINADSYISTGEGILEKNMFEYCGNNPVNMADSTVEIAISTLILIASIAHAIMMNNYPELSFEQSWDGFNYSIQDGEGVRGTLSFFNGFCVVAIRDDNGEVFQGEKERFDVLLNEQQKN